MVVTTVTPRTSPKKKEDQLKWHSAVSQLFTCPLHAAALSFLELFPTEAPETTEAKFLVPDWGYIVDSGIGLS
jgi:hypothetical protein